MKRYVVVDIDGTLTKVGARVECLKATPPDWDSFYARCGEDAPMEPIITLVRKLHMVGYTIILLSGRRESCRKDTEAWMEKHGVGYDLMLLRADGDHRHDTEVKPKLLDNYGIPFTQVAFVLEDRASMVKKWRELEMTCLQVAEGDF